MQVLGGRHVNYEAGRISPRYEGQRFISGLALYLLTVADTDHDGRLQQEVWFSESGLYQEQQARKGRVKVTNSMTFSSYATCKSQLQRACVDHQNFHSDHVTILLDPAVIDEDMIDKLFDKEFFVAHGNYRTVELTVHSVREVAKSSTTFISRGTDGAATGLSFADFLLVDMGVAYVCYIYTLDTRTTLHHIHRHMVHASRVASPGVSVRFVVLVPGSVDDNLVHEMVEDGGGRWVPSDMPREHTQVYYRDAHKAKL